MHTFLSVDLSLLPLGVRYSANSKALGLFSNEDESTRLLIDGYLIGSDGEYLLDDGGKVLVHTDGVMNSWSNSHTEIIASAIEYTEDQYLAEKSNINSIWYLGDES